MLTNNGEHKRTKRCINAITLTMHADIKLHNVEFNSM